MSDYDETPRPTVPEEAERLLDYWEQHGDNPETVAKWAATDLLSFVRFVLEEES
jgi:hypothetical protein